MKTAETPTHTAVMQDLGIDPGACMQHGDRMAAILEKNKSKILTEGY